MQVRKLKKVLFIALLFLVASTIIFWIAKSGKDADSKKISLYFFNSDQSALCSVEKDFTAETDTELYQKVVDSLVKGPSAKKLSGIMNKNTAVNSIVKEGSYLTVDFSKEYSDSGILTTYAVAKTLCGIAGVQGVRIMVDGIAISEFISGDEINLESDTDCTQGINLYFANKDKTKLVKEFRRINMTDTQPIEQYIVSELIKGPKLEKSERLIAPDTGVISVETTDGTCYVNFKQDFIDRNNAPVEQERLIIYSIVNSLTDRDNVVNVQLLIEGKKTDKIGDFAISDLFERSEGLIEN